MDDLYADVPVDDLVPDEPLLDGDLPPVFPDDPERGGPGPRTPREPIPPGRVLLFLLVGALLTGLLRVGMLVLLMTEPDPRLVVAVGVVYWTCLAALFLVGGLLVSRRRT